MALKSESTGYPVVDRIPCSLKESLALRLPELIALLDAVRLSSDELEDDEDVLRELCCLWEGSGEPPVLGVLMLLLLLLCWS